jgi:DNA-binding CsgD family transcriptional regulator
MLSPRQREILGRVAAGRTSKEIASELGISERTVNWHISKAFGRLGASSRAEAVAITMRDDANGNGDTKETEVHERPVSVGRPSLAPLALAVLLALLLGMLGGALIAGWHLQTVAPYAPIAVPTQTVPTHSAAATAPNGDAPRVAEAEASGSAATVPATEVTQPLTRVSAPSSLPVLPQALPRSTALPVIPTALAMPAVPPAQLTTAPAVPSLAPLLRSVP